MDQPRHVSSRRFLAAAANARVVHAELLVHGRLWRPPVVELGRAGKAVDDLCVSDHGFDKKGPYSPPLTCCNVSAVPIAVWLTADGALGLVAVNHVSAEEANGAVALTATLTTPTAWAGRCCVAEPPNVVRVGDGVVTVTLSLDPGAIGVVMLRPRPS